MSIDNTKAKFSSLWDIDQLVEQPIVRSVDAGVNNIYTITTSPSIPTYEVQFKPTGSTRWFSEGMSSTNDTVAGKVTMFSYVASNTISVNCPSSGTVRLFLWRDRIDN